MSKLASGSLLLIIAVLVFPIGGMVALSSLGLSFGGGIPPSSNGGGIAMGVILMIASALTFLIGLVKIIQGIFMPSINENNDIDKQNETLEN